jgi:hypothetical protein
MRDRIASIAWIHRGGRFPMAQVETPVEVKPLTVAGERVTTDETRVVRSPWDGSEVAAVPVVGARETKAAIDAAADAMTKPLPAHEPACSRARSASR